MSRIDDLVATLCPDGVEFRPLGELLDYEQPGQYLVASTRYDDSFATPVLTAGQTFVLGYTEETDGIYPATPASPVIIFDDFTTAFRWVDFPFKAKSSAMKMLTLRPGVDASLRYVYFAMKGIDFAPGNHARHWIAQYSHFRIPVPPLEVQQEIVRVLDQFTRLEAELEAELEARRRQYRHHREMLFDFQDDIPRVHLPEVSINRDGERRPITKAAREPGPIPYYGASGVVDFVRGFIFDGDFLLVSEDGANLLARSTPIAFSVSGKTWVNNHAHVLEFGSPSDRRYTEFYLNAIDLSPYVSGAAQPKLNQANLNRIPIPWPSPERRAAIVAALDQFDALVNDLSVGLPAELNARRKQYEYYRDKLLTFKEAPA